MRYRINWTENVGYYAYVEADTPEEALEAFEDCTGDFHPQPDDFCEVERDSIEVVEDTSGYYIWADATCVAGPFESVGHAKAALEPNARKKWTWELSGGLEAFLKIPTEHFTISYHKEGVK
jgi:hypothetical protein